jgi:hypothetical protein
VATLIYASLAELKSYMNETTDTADDANLNICLTGASRAIDGVTARRFWIDDAPTAQVYRTRGNVTKLPDGELLLTKDIAATSGVVVEGWEGSGYAVIGASSYELYPESDISLGRAATGILMPDSGWSTYRKVRVTATWGWPAVPGVVKQACLIQAQRLYSRKDSPNGAMGDVTWGVMRVPYMDPDVKVLLRPLCIPGFA